jgi:hypothetical protein
MPSAYHSERARWKCYEQFRRDAQGALDCKLVPLNDLLFGVVTDLARGPLCEAFVRWSNIVSRTKPGEGPHCFTCDAELGPGRTIPAAFWFRFPVARRRMVMAIDALCPTCFEREDCLDRIVVESRKHNPDLRVIPTTKQ